MPALLTPGQAAQWLGLSPSSVYRAVRLGRLAAVKPLGSGEVRFRLADLAALVDTLEPINQEAAVSAVLSKTKATTEISRPVVADEVRHSRAASQ